MLGRNKKSGIPASEEYFVEGKTIIGEGISLTGDIQGMEDLVIEGVVKGRIELKKNYLILSLNGKIEGEIVAENVTILGRMTGSVRALGKLEIKKEAEFNGEIKAKEISVEDGTNIKAAIEIDGE
jgi:cytoskeletal protein CcmA (bactofilin family)